jgi:hypothetical protein
MSRSALCLLTVAICCFVPATASAADDDAGFRSLFDGRTLDGWHKNSKKIGHGTGEQDPPGSGNGGILLTDHKYGDFELLIDLKPDWGVCSGLFLRSTDEGKCLQMMVDYHERGNVGHVYGEGVGGFNTRPFDIFGIYGDDKQLIGLRTEPTKNPAPAYSISAADWVKTWRVNDWNTARVRVVGNPAVMTTWINGTKICEFNGNTFQDKRYDKQKVADTLGDKNYIAVQVHGGKSWPAGAKCRWKNVKIKELSN